MCERDRGREWETGGVGGGGAERIVIKMIS